MSGVEIHTLTDYVLYCLKEFPASRNSDKLLTWKIWETFFWVRDKIDFNKFMELPTEDAVKRLRAKIQNEDKKFLPTNKEVAIQRGWKENEWLEALGYKPKDQLDMFDESRELL